MIGRNRCHYLKPDTRSLPLKHPNQSYRSCLARQTIRPRTRDFQPQVGEHATRSALYKLRRKLIQTLKNQRLHTSSRGKLTRSARYKERKNLTQSPEEVLPPDKQPKDRKSQIERLLSQNQHNTYYQSSTKPVIEKKNKGLQT